MKIKYNDIFNKTKLKLQIPANAAASGNPYCPVLGQYGININNFCVSFNNKTFFIKKGLLLCVDVLIVESTQNNKDYNISIKGIIKNELLYNNSFLKNNYNAKNYYNFYLDIIDYNSLVKIKKIHEKKSFSKPSFIIGLLKLFLYNSNIKKVLVKKIKLYIIYKLLDIVLVFCIQNTSTISNSWHTNQIILPFYLKYITNISNIF